MALYLDAALEQFPRLSSLTHLDLIGSLRWEQLQHLGNALLETPARKTELKLAFSEDIEEELENEGLLELTAKLETEKSITLYTGP